MTPRTRYALGLLLLAVPAAARAEPAPFVGSPAPAVPSLPGSPQVPLDALAPGVRDKVRAVLDAPSLASQGPVEASNGDPAMYRWLLDHPHVAIKLWQQLGAKVVDVRESRGVYSWKDDAAGEAVWYCVSKSEGTQIWYAEGKAKPSALLPMTAFKAVAVMHYVTGKDKTGKPAVKHQVHFRLKCDSKTVSLAAKVFGASMPKMAEQHLQQLQMFYGGMAWYLFQDAERARKMFAALGIAP